MRRVGLCLAVTILLVACLTINVNADEAFYAKGSGVIELNAGVRMDWLSFGFT
jgi:hypothetical protein